MSNVQFSPKNEAKTSKYGINRENEVQKIENHCPRSSSIDPQGFNLLESSRITVFQADIAIPWRCQQSEAIWQNEEVKYCSSRFE